MQQPLRLAIAADHGGFELKRRLAAHLRAQGHHIEDLGPNSPEPVDYPRIAIAVAEHVASERAVAGIVIDRVGIGSAMAANKVAGIRAAACYTEAQARGAREHNDANLLALGAAETDPGTAARIVDAFLTASCTAERHRRRVQMIRAYERQTTATGGHSGATDVSRDDLLRIAARVRGLLRSEAPAREAPIPPARLVTLIDHTLLRPDATLTDIQRLCDEARRFRFFAVCVNPVYVREARERLRDTGVKVCAVVGFPLGAQSPEVKALETRRALREGAQEIDVVINVGALKGRDDSLVLRDLRGVVEACADSRATSKVILETALLTDEEKVRACELAVRAGANFVKTSTGFSSAGATPEDVALMSRTVGPRGLGVKAAGGIRTYSDVLRMTRAGATRVGSSSSVRIMEEASGLSRTPE